MSAGDRRALLEAVAYGNDPDLKPGDRLRALEMLNELEPESPDLDNAFRAGLARLDGPALDRQLDALCGAEIVADAVAEGGRYPIMAALIREAIEARARELAERIYLTPRRNDCMCSRGMAHADGAGNAVLSRSIHPDFARPAP